MQWLLNLFPQYRAMERQIEALSNRVMKAETQAAWAQSKLDEALASERRAWEEVAQTAKCAADLSSQYGFGRSMFGVGPEVERRKNEVEKVAGYRNVRDITRRAQHEILSEIEKAEQQLGLN